MKKCLIVVAGGIGSRMQAARPKQFIELSGVPILMRTLLNIKKADANVMLILVLPEAYISEWNRLCQLHEFNLNHEVVAGGATRFSSVRNGLGKVLADTDIVGIHDGVRPFVNPKMLQNCFKSAEYNDGVIPVIPVVDSLRECKNRQSRPIKRDNFRLVQTPQFFKYSVIKKAYEMAINEDYTDDASVVEAAGYKVTLKDGDPDNIKITTPLDLALAELILKKKTS